MKPVQFADYREAKLVEGLNQLAKQHGIAFRQPLQIDGNGEFSLNVEPSTPQIGFPNACGHYGETFVALLNQFNPRTGIYPTRHMLPENGWCRIHHFNAEAMLVAAKILDKPLTL